MLSLKVLTSYVLIRHANTFTVRADPCWSVRHPPPILLKTFFTNHKPTRATKAVRKFFFAAVTNIFFILSSTIFFFFLFFTHFCSSSSNHFLYSSLTSRTGVEIISGTSYGCRISISFLKVFHRDSTLFTSNLYSVSGSIKIGRAHV